ncbi:rCG61276 [Rattus norvegicus]|uniref:RCG61276 n=1 Tax=Rattus norvegicus TaxID=10116 RepID=A6KE31_RAT|nr:rCG61276 [Rattus norvegicus]
MPPRSPVPELILPQRYPHAHVFCCSVHKCMGMEPPYLSLSWCLGKESMAYMHKGCYSVVKKTEAMEFTEIIAVTEKDRIE